MPTFVPSMWASIMISVTGISEKTRDLWSETRAADSSPSVFEVVQNVVSK